MTTLKIERIESWPVAVPLTRPYTIAFKTFDAVEMMAVRLVTGGSIVGLGSASPEASVTGETFAVCREALSSATWLHGQTLERPAALCHELRARLHTCPAACAALDMAIWDAWAKSLERPLVDLLGRAHGELATSITIGIKNVADTVEESEEYVGRGFRVLKVKLGQSLAEDLERMVKLRERWGAAVVLRVDANQGYTLGELESFLAESAALGIELTEQPVAARETVSLRSLPPGKRLHLAADESLLDESDALRLAAEPKPCGIYNIKLMKCGGIRPGLGIARVAEAAGIDLMWGCMDESVISIAAALHAAFASPNTRYLDLDGSFDLARDYARGGFSLENGVMRTLERPGLGVELVDQS
jgi:L-alanine-DL-glutamate epimerase-like enolase superfamily enzyme